ncbi:hypothetical protein CYMTET_39697 [Cymbomonas tetramitiformis]|uniref:DRBM domain-containing protein n=1 Tax=Cymbomonas tetramitiformis TaxID=36881 RepID=A0AAE0CBM0_9CHLO|nr:hypothetical protein CYMTET_39697 [Cymbomonas tetramitiformis]
MADDYGTHVQKGTEEPVGAEEPVGTEEPTGPGTWNMQASVDVESAKVEYGQVEVEGRIAPINYDIPIPAFAAEKSAIRSEEDFPADVPPCPSSSRVDDSDSNQAKTDSKTTDQLLHQKQTSVDRTASADLLDFLEDGRFPLVRRWLTTIRSIPKYANKTPVMLFHEYATKFHLQAKMDVKFDSITGSFYATATLVGADGIITYSSGIGSARLKREAKQIAAAGCMETLLSSMPEKTYSNALKGAAAKEGPKARASKETLKKSADTSEPHAFLESEEFKRVRNLLALVNKPDSGSTIREGPPKTPLMLLNEYVTRKSLVVAYVDNTEDAKSGVFDITAFVSGKDGTSYGVFHGKARGKKEAKQMAAAGCIENFLEQIPQSEFTVSHTSQRHLQQRAGVVARGGKGKGKGGAHRSRSGSGGTCGASGATGMSLATIGPNGGLSAAGQIVSPRYGIARDHPAGGVAYSHLSQPLSLEGFEGGYNPANDRGYEGGMKRDFCAMSPSSHGAPDPQRQRLLGQPGSEAFGAWPRYPHISNVHSSFGAGQHGEAFVGIPSGPLGGGMPHSANPAMTGGYLHFQPY